MNTPTPPTSDAIRKAGLLLPVLRNSAKSWGNHHCAGELRRAIELIESLLSTREIAAQPVIPRGEYDWEDDPLPMPAAQPGEGSSPDILELMAHGVFVYEIDYGPDDKWRGVRLEDFNKVVAKLTSPPHVADALDGEREVFVKGYIAAGLIWAHSSISPAQLHKFANRDFDKAIAARAEAGGT